MNQRTNILHQFADRLDLNHGPAAAVVPNRYFRQVFRRPWKPGNPIRPVATVHDNGQQAVNQDGVDTESQDRELSIHLVIDLAANWDRQTVNEDWSDRVETLVLGMQNWLPAGVGALRMNYLRDDPMDVILQEGKTESIWLVEFICLYHVDIGLLGKT